MQTTEADFGKFSWKCIATIVCIMQIFRSTRQCEGLDLEIRWQEDLSRKSEGWCEEDQVGQSVRVGKGTKDLHVHVPLLTADVLELSINHSALLCAHHNTSEVTAGRPCLKDHPWNMTGLQRSRLA